MHNLVIKISVFNQYIVTSGRPQINRSKVYSFSIFHPSEADFAVIDHNRSYTGNEFDTIVYCIAESTVHTYTDYNIINLNDCLTWDDSW